MNYANPIYCIPFADGQCILGASCAYRHDIFKCSCGHILPIANQAAHLEGKRHKFALTSIKALSNPSKRRKRAPKTQNDSGSNAVNTGNGWSEQPQLMKCDHCRKKIEYEHYNEHVAEHAKQQRRSELETELENATADKQGVIVSGRNGIDFGVLNEDNTIDVKISVQSTTCNVILKACKMRSSVRGDEHGVKFSATLRGKSRRIHQGGTRHVFVTMHGSFAGHFEDTLELVFYNISQPSTFVITRKVEGTVGSREDHDLLHATVPYERRRPTKFVPVGPVVPSNRPPAWTKTRWTQSLAPFNPPRRLIHAAASPHKGALAAIKQFMPPEFEIKTYGNWFQVLLYLEEDRMKQDLDAYSLVDQTLDADYPRYRLLVEGLAESRPSVLVGDFILVSHTGPADTLNTRTWYEGRVHKVHEKHVSLHFGDNFSTYRGTKFDVRFVLNRLSFRRMHQALVDSNNPARLLFPDTQHLQGAARLSQKKIAEIRPFNRSLGEDIEQMEAVAAIINQKPGSVPFVVFGPPGTGKTVTIVEAMLQILDKDPNARILACAPNNSAADNIAKRLLNLGSSQIFRLNALSRKVHEMTRDLRPFANINNNAIFAMPSLEQIMKYRIVISTCLSGGVPFGLGVKKGHFTHIFIDEAGQGKEPEVMVPIKNNAGPNTNVILAGDNRQLGPVINSPFASSLGLKLSYLDRIMQRSIYDLDTARGITIVKLVKNFRSHPDIIKFSNDQFYASELQTCGDQAITHSLQNYDELPKRQFPVIFHGIVGKDQREAKSPSFFNIDEITQVKKYCLSLIENRRYAIKAEHIGVITPYHSQRCKMLDLFHRDTKLQGITVGSVEEFQGQERRVIIISTVRSNKDYIKADIRRSLGFVANKQRLNVALTRAQALLIVIGNPIVLSLDPIWRGFLNYVHLNGGWRGKPIDWDPEETVSQASEYYLERKRHADSELEEAIARLQAMIITKHDDDPLDVGDDEDEEAATFERPILREAE